MTRHNTHDEGDRIRVRAEWTDTVSGVPLDPDVVRLSIRDPISILRTYTYLDGDMEIFDYATGVTTTAPADLVIAKETAGNYFAEIAVDLPGKWTYRWFSEGNGEAADERFFMVREAVAAIP